MAWTAVNNNGMLEICGSFSSSGSSYVQNANRAVLKEAKVVSDGKTLRRNLIFFKRLPNEGPADKHVGEEVKCKTTKHDYPAGNIDIEFRSGSYKIYR